MTLTPESFMTASLRSLPWGERVGRVLAAAIQAVEPGQAVRRFVQRTGDTLLVDGAPLSLTGFRRVYVVGAGKAGAPMAATLAQILGDRLEAGLVIVKEGYGGQGAEGAGGRPAEEPDIAGRVWVAPGGHPLPDRRGVEATRQIIDLLRTSGEDDLVFCLLSGGGSALLTSPAQGVALEEMQELTSLLLGCGATINEINTLRKHLDEVKGGRLARLAAPSRLITLILSDVVGDPLDIIASGPTVPDPSTYQDAWAVLEKYDLAGKIPASIRDHLEKGTRGALPDTPKATDPVFQRVWNIVIGNNPLAAEAARAAAEAEGFHSQVLTTEMQGEARLAGQALGKIARRLAAGDPLPRPACLIAGGETTVTLRGKGLGGRNQEMALGAVPELAGLRQMLLVTLATDGGDGPTDAAGAVVTGDTLERARALGMDPGEFLVQNDSYHFFAALDDLLKPGPTRTNVNDLALIFAA